VSEIRTRQCGLPALCRCSCVDSSSIQGNLLAALSNLDWVGRSTIALVERAWRRRILAAVNDNVIAEKVRRISHAVTRCLKPGSRPFVETREVALEAPARFPGNARSGGCRQDLRACRASGQRRTWSSPTPATR
jgi:hypothetical protein